MHAMPYKKCHAMLYLLCASQARKHAMQCYAVRNNAMTVSMPTSVIAISVKTSSLLLAGGSLNQAKPN